MFLVRDREGRSAGTPDRFSGSNQRFLSEFDLATMTVDMTLEPERRQPGLDTKRTFRSVQRSESQLRSVAFGVLIKRQGGFMHGRLLLAAFAVVIGTLHAQPRKMTLVGGGAPDRGKCTIDVVVDGSAEIEVHGDTAVLRDLSGASPQWRRFECTGPLPANPGDFRFAGVDGRGRQQLLRDPRNGGSAVVRIDDPDSGPEGYTFDLMWGRAAPPPPIQSGGNAGGFDRQRDDRGPGVGGDRDSYHSERDEAFRGQDWRAHLFVRIREDLDHVQAVSFPGGDQYRIERARRELNQLQDLQDQGRYNRRQLDDVVMALGRVVADNRLAARDRDLLNDDLRRLQNFRGNVRDYGVR